MPGSGLSWTIKVGDRSLTLNVDDITVGELRQIKGWFGPEIGRNLAFQTALLQQDPEAILCAIWLARKKAGDTDVPEPNSMPDEKVVDVIEFMGVEGEVPEGERPTSPAANPDSTPTPTDSEANGSDSSPSTRARTRAKPTS